MKKIKCYIIRTGKCFSDPLTVRYYKNKKDFIDVLVHELIHQIQIQNSEKFKKWKKYLEKKFPNESNLTINHILLHSIHKKIYLKSFNKKRLENNIKKDNNYYDYKRAWEIVEDIGADEIINSFKKKHLYTNKIILIYANRYNKNEFKRTSSHHFRYEKRH